MDRYPVQAVIAPSARKHGIEDEDMQHALKYHWYSVFPDDSDVMFYVGPSRTAEPLELGVLDDLDGRTVIHAMAARPKYLRWIKE